LEEEAVDIVILLERIFKKNWIGRHELD